MQMFAGDCVRRVRVTVSGLSLLHLRARPTQCSFQCNFQCSFQCNFQCSLQCSRHTLCLGRPICGRRSAKTANHLAPSRWAVAKMGKSERPARRPEAPQGPTAHRSLSAAQSQSLSTKLNSTQLSLSLSLSCSLALSRSQDAHPTRQAAIFIPQL